jgi:hypothetical protein
MKTLRWFTRLLASKTGRRPAARPPVRPLLETLEDRTVCNTYTWAPLATAANLHWDNGANWVDNTGIGDFNDPSRRGTVPTSSDTAAFGNISETGLNTAQDCYIPPDTAVQIHAVQMDDGYTNALFVGFAPDVSGLGGASITGYINPYDSTFEPVSDFREHGGLNLYGSFIDCGGSFHIYGAVFATDSGSTASGGLGSSIEADDGFYLTSPEGGLASILAFGSRPVFSTTPAPVALTMIGAIDNGGDITVGQPLPGDLRALSSEIDIVGDVTSTLPSHFTAFAGGTFGMFLNTEGDGFTVQGALDLYTGPYAGTGGTIANAGTQDVKLDGGVLTVRGGLADAATITGNLYNNNGGTVRFADYLDGGATAVQTLAILGTYKQITDPTEPSAVYGTLDIALQGGASDLVTVGGGTGGGTATLGGNLHIANTGVAPLPGGGYVWDILTATGGIVGNFGIGSESVVDLGPLANEAVVAGPPDVVTVS